MAGRASMADGDPAVDPAVGRADPGDGLPRLSMIEQANSKAAHEGAGRLDVFYRSQVTSVHRRGPGIHGVTAVLDGRKTDIVCSVLIDATEYGDILPLANALYRAGNSKSPVIDSSARIQDITWVAVIKKYPGGIPQNLRITPPPQLLGGGGVLPYVSDRAFPPPLGRRPW
mgnify:CR=1 FL=1